MFFTGIYFLDFSPCHLEPSMRKFTPCQNQQAETVSLGGKLLRFREGIR